MPVMPDLQIRLLKLKSPVVWEGTELDKRVDKQDNGVDRASSDS